jgi:Kef-type K+ transport system membrane component KefB
MNTAEATPIMRSAGRSTAVVYAGVLVLFAGAIAGVLKLGGRLEPAELAVSTVFAARPPTGVEWPRMLVQVGVIIGASRALGWAMRWIGQPQVVGEITAGIALGPSVLGWIAPHASAVLFPASSLNVLGGLSQIGLTLFMFLVGLELDVSAIRRKSHAVVMTSHVSIIFPFFLGSALSLALYSRLAPANVPFTHFALFMGISMSVTAFPVLARILSERGMIDSPVGSVTLACAAVGDITAWCILAGVVVLVRADAALPFWATVAGSLAFSAVMVFGVRRLLSRISSRYHEDGRVGEGTFALIFLLLVASACITEYLGIHALFGAFLMGAIMPKDRSLVSEVRKKINHLTVVLLLPIFFALTGLRTNVSTLGDARMWVYAGLILAAAVVGKFGGSLLSARFSGSSWREAATIGILMNTRGLVELVVLNIGYDVGVISKPLFVMLVLMALFTTMMTAPVLDRLGATGAEPELATRVRSESGQESAAS